MDNIYFGAAIPPSPSSDDDKPRIFAIGGYPGPHHSFLVGPEIQRETFETIPNHGCISMVNVEKGHLTTI